MQNFIDKYKDVLHVIAEISSSTLELIGIIIIIVGSALALGRLLKSLVKKEQFRVVASLGRGLAIALEFKMGAEIIKTVIIHDLEELAILGAVIIIRALLAFIIHWEIRIEEKERDLKNTDKSEQ
ncbi:MAG: DUF1622 domain-containing protein [Clostridia bacterium]|nr:DUF1622 domain-containing protein [Clostridia bacterium]